MHEISIINNVINTIEDEFEEADIKRLKCIYLKVGKLSNIEPNLLNSAYHAYTFGEKKYSGVELIVDSTDILIQCEVCNTITKVLNYKFICSNCKRPSKNLIQGEELLIHKVEFND